MCVYTLYSQPKKPKEQEEEEKKAELEQCTRVMWYVRLFRSPP